MTGRDPRGFFGAPAALLGSGLRLGWAMSLFAAEQTARLVSGEMPRSSRRRAGASRLGLPNLGLPNLGLPDLGLPDLGLPNLDFPDLDFPDLGAAFGARMLVRLALVDGGLGTVRRALGTLAPALGRDGVEMRRAADILEAVELFAGAALQPLSGPGGDGEGLEAKVHLEARRLLESDSYASLWRLEGLGFARAEALARAGESQILDADPLPAAALMPLVTGLGLSSARRAVSLLGPRGDDLEGHLRRCQDSSPPGTRLLLVEATGFIACQLAPLRVEDLGEVVGRLGEEARAAYWHGAGRGLYFAGPYLRPGGARAALRRAANLANPLARQGALAGAAWAVVLVHLRHPRVLDHVLEQAGETLGAAALRHGARGALTAWLIHLDQAGEDSIHDKELREDPLVAGLLDHPPASSAWPRLLEGLHQARQATRALRRGELAWDRLYRFLPGEEDRHGE